MRRQLHEVERAARPGGGEGVYGERDGIRRALVGLPKIGHLPPDFVSSDLHPYLEYETPKGNVYGKSTLLPNVQWLHHFNPAGSLPEAVVQNVPTSRQWSVLRDQIATEQAAMLSHL